MRATQLSLPGHAPAFTDARFMSAAQKRLVIRAWERFLKEGLRWKDFTHGLYEHLIQHCSFIAHYDRAGFFACYFAHGEDAMHFLSQFDARSAGPGGLPLCIEYGYDNWARDGEYGDINQAMICTASLYIPQLLPILNDLQYREDVARIMRIAQKHNITVTVGKERKCRSTSSKPRSGK